MKITQLLPSDRGRGLASTLQPADGPSVLCMGRYGLDADLRVLRLRSQSSGHITTWHNLHCDYLTQALADLVPEAEQIQGRTWWDGASVDVCRGLLEAVRPRAVVSANINYWPDVPLRKACWEMGVPFVVLCREHWCVPSDADAFAGAAGCHDIAAVCVAGAASAAVLTRHGTVMRDRVHVTGLPRWDEWDGLQDEPRTLAVLLSYAEGYAAAGNYADVQRAFAAAIDAYPDRLLVRTKSDAGSLPALLNRARLVIGFNSLALVDAMLSPAEVVIPQWGDAVLPVAEMMFPPGTPGVRYPRTPAELRVMIDWAMQRDYRKPPQLDAVRALVHYDGRACENFMAVMERVI